MSNENDELPVKGWYLTPEPDALVLLSDAQRIKDERDRLLGALSIAEAALADIGDADRELGDDLAWCERRAAEVLPEVRAALAGEKK